MEGAEGWFDVGAGCDVVGYVVDEGGEGDAAGVCLGFLGLGGWFLGLLVLLLLLLFILGLGSVGKVTIGAGIVVSGGCFWELGFRVWFVGFCTWSWVVMTLWLFFLVIGMVRVRREEGGGN